MRPKAETVVFAGALVASLAAALLIAGAPAAARAPAAEPSRAVAPCGLLAAAVAPGAAVPCPEDGSRSTPAPTPTATPTPSVTPAPRAAQPCLVSLHLPRTVRAKHALRIRVQAADTCFGGSSRTVLLSLRRTAGHHRAVTVRWTAGTKPHDVVLRHGVPTRGHWRLVVVSGRGLSALTTGTLAARR